MAIPKRALSSEVIDGFLAVVYDPQWITDVRALERMFYEPNIVWIIFYKQNGEGRVHFSFQPMTQV